QVSEDRHLASPGVVLIKLPARQVLGPAVGGLAGAVAVVERAAEVNLAIRPLVDPGVDLGPCRLARLRRNDFVHVHDGLEDLAARVPAVQEAASVAHRIVAVVTDGAIDPAIPGDADVAPRGPQPPVHRVVAEVAVVSEIYRWRLAGDDERSSAFFLGCR